MCHTFPESVSGLRHFSHFWAVHGFPAFSESPFRVAYFSRHQEGGMGARFRVVLPLPNGRGRLKYLYPGEFRESGDKGIDGRRRGMTLSGP